MNLWPERGSSRGEEVPTPADMVFARWNLSLFADTVTDPGTP